MLCKGYLASEALTCYVADAFVEWMRLTKWVAVLESLCHTVHHLLSFSATDQLGYSLLNLLHSPDFHYFFVFFRLLACSIWNFHFFHPHFDHWLENWKGKRGGTGGSG